MLIKTIPFLVFFVVLVFLPTGCASSQPPDFPILAGAFKFVGCCSVIASVVWAYAIVRGTNNRRGGK